MPLGGVLAPIYIMPLGRVLSPFYIMPLGGVSAPLSTLCRVQFSYGCNMPLGMKF